MHSPLRPDLNDARIALVHDWFTTFVGGERVVEQIIQLFPQAKLFASIDTLPPEQRAFLGGREITTSPAQNWRFVRRHYRALLPLMMLSIEQLDVSGHDIVLTSSSSIAKGVLTAPDQLHVCYVHSPMRYAWDMQHQYLRDAGLDRGLRSLLARAFLHHARLWDLRTANGVDFFAANSTFIANRIWKVYRREATVIHPPVDVDGFTLREKKEDFYLSVARMVPYKKVPAVVAAFRSLPERRLVVIGDGPEMDQVKSTAGRNVEVLGFQPTHTVRDYMQRARAMVFAAEEDFGIGPVEAQACGTPVIAFGRGGALETIRGHEGERRTGLFFDGQAPSDIAGAILNFETIEHEIAAAECRSNALRFSAQHFRDRYRAFVADCWDRFAARARAQ